MKYAKSEIIRRLSDLNRKGWTNTQVKDLIDSLWRDEVPWATSGFKIAGGTDSLISFDPSSLHFIIQAADSKFQFYSFGTMRPTLNTRTDPEERDLSGNPSLAGSGIGTDGDGVMEEGLYLVYYDTDPDDKLQKLTFVFNPTVAQEQQVYLTKVPVAWVFYEEMNGCIYLGDERHGYEWEPHVHWWAHRTFNGIVDSGLLFTNIPASPGGDDDNDAKFGISAGSMWHEDMVHELTEESDGTGVPIFFFYGDGSVRKTENSGYLVVNTPGGLVNFNAYELPEGEEEGGEQWIFKQAQDGNYVLCHMFMTNCTLTPLIAWMGMAEYIDAPDAIMGSIDEVSYIEAHMPHRTRVYLGSVLFKTQLSYSNDMRAIISDSWTYQTLSAKIASAIAQKSAAFLKTGWHPQVQELVTFEWDDASKTISITPKKGYCPYYILGKEYKLDGTLATAVPGTYGKTYFYVEYGDISIVPKEWSKAWLNNGEWDNSTNEFCMVAVVFYDPVNQRPLYVGYEMHSYEIEPRTRGNIHRNDFTILVSGLEVSDSGGQLEIGYGLINDEDIKATITNYDDWLFGQPLWPLQAQKCYLISSGTDGSGGDGLPSGGSGAGSAMWRDDIEALASTAITGSGNKVMYNRYDPETGWSLEPLDVGEFTAMWVLATMDYTWPVKLITGSEKGATADAATEANSDQSLAAIISATTFFCEEYVVLGLAVVECIAAYPYYSLTSVTDKRNTDFKKMANDRYVKEAEFDEDSRTLTLRRTMDMPDLGVVIPRGLTDRSVDGDGSFENPFQLTNDVDQPGAFMLYGTNSAGTRGWYRFGGGGGGTSGTSGSGAAPVETPFDDKYVSSATVGAVADGELAAVDNVNNMLKIVLQRTGGLAALELLLGGMAGFKVWHGDVADLPETRDADTIYLVNEES